MNPLQCIDKVAKPFYPEYSASFVCSLLMASSGGAANMSKSYSAIYLDIVLDYLISNFKLKPQQICTMQQNNSGAQKGKYFVYNFIAAISEHCIAIGTNYDLLEIIYTNQGHVEAMQIIEKIPSCYKEYNYNTQGYLFLVSDNFACEEIQLKPLNKTFKDLYSEEFLPIHQKVLNFLHSEESGLIVLCGESGSGKTTYLRYLIETEKIKFSTIKSTIFESLDLEYYAFLLTDYADSVLIIEDVDSLNDIYHQTNDLLRNFTSLSDGFLNEISASKTIITLNVAKNKLNNSIFQHANIKVLYEFIAQNDNCCAD